MDGKKKRSIRAISTTNIAIVCTIHAGEKERERERERESDRETDRQRQTETETERNKQRERDRETEKCNIRLCCMYIIPVTMAAA